jgi:hypothetical protein
MKPLHQIRANSANNLDHKGIWTPAIRALHWLTALTLFGASSLTSHGDNGHAELAWISIALLLIIQLIYVRSKHANPVIWVLLISISAHSLSCWLTPDTIIYTMTSLAAVCISAFYLATVIFESINYSISRSPEPVHRSPVQTFSALR